jgi:hypothetical protein
MCYARIDQLANASPERSSDNGTKEFFNTLDRFDAHF